MDSKAKKFIPPRSSSKASKRTQFTRYQMAYDFKNRYGQILVNKYRWSIEGEIVELFRSIDRKITVVEIADKEGDGCTIFLDPKDAA